MWSDKKDILNKKHLKTIINDDEFLKQKEITTKDFAKFLKTNNLNTTEYFIKYVNCCKTLDEKLQFFQDSCKEATNSELYLSTFLDEVLEEYIKLYFSDINKFKYGNDELKKIVDCIGKAKELVKNDKTKRFYGEIYSLLSAITQYKGENYSELWYVAMYLSILNEQHFNKTIGFLTYLMFKEISWLDLRFIFDIDFSTKNMSNSPKEFKELVRIIQPIEKDWYKLGATYSKAHNNNKLELINNLSHSFFDKIIKTLLDDKCILYKDFTKKFEYSKVQQQTMKENKKKLLQTLYFYTYWEKIALSSYIHSNDDVNEIVDKKKLLSLFKDFDIDNVSDIIKNICKQKKFTWTLDIDFDKIDNFKYAFKTLYYISRDSSQNSSSLSSLHNLLWDECELKNKNNIDKLENEEGFLISIGIYDVTNLGFMYDVILNDPLDYKKYKLPSFPKKFTDFDISKSKTLAEKKILFCEQSDYVIDSEKHKQKLKDYTNKNLINLFATRNTIHIKKMRNLEQHSEHFFDQFLQKDNFIHLIKLMFYICKATTMRAKNTVEIAIAKNLYSPLIGTLVESNGIEISEELTEEYDKLKEDIDAIYNEKMEQLRKKAEAYDKEQNITDVNYQQEQTIQKWVDKESAPMYKEIFKRIDIFVEFLEEKKGSKLEYVDITTYTNPTLIIKALLTLVFGSDTIYEKISSKYNLEIGLYIQYLMYKHCSEIMYDE